MELNPKTALRISIQRLTGSYHRPVMLMGPLALTISEGLLKIYGDNFQRCTQGIRKLLIFMPYSY